MVRKLEEVTSGGGLYLYYIYQNVFGRLDFEGAGFNTRWRVIPPGADKNTIDTIERRASIEVRDYISKNNKLPLRLKFSCLERVGQIVMKIDNLDYEFLE